MAEPAARSGPAVEAAGGGAHLQAALRKTTWRLIPFMFLLYVVAYLDRVNIGFVSPSLIGLLKKQTGSFRGGILLIAGGMLVATVLIAVGTRRLERRQLSRRSRR